MQEQKSLDRKHLWAVSNEVFHLLQWFNDLALPVEAVCWICSRPPFTALKLPIYKPVIEIRQLIYLVIVFFMPPDRFSNWLPGAFLPRPAGSGWHGVRKFIPRSGFLPHIILQQWFQKNKRKFKQQQQLQQYDWCGDDDKQIERSVSHSLFRLWNPKGASFALLLHLWEGREHNKEDSFFHFLKLYKTCTCI